MLEEIEEEKENLDLIDGIVDTVKESVKSFIFFFWNEIENLDILETGEIAPKTLSKLTAVFTNKKYNKVEKINNIFKASCSQRMARTKL